MKSKRKFFRRALSVVLSLVMLVSIMAITPVTAGAANGVQTKINQLQAVYSNGTYFTKSGGPCYSDGGNDCALSNIPSRGGLPSGASVVSATGWSGNSCFAFAHYAFYYIFGTTSMTQVSLSDAQVGDMIYFSRVHWGIYLGQDSSNIYIYDSNGDWTNVNGTYQSTNKVLTKHSCGKSSWSVSAVYHATNYDTINGGSTSDDTTGIDLGTNFYALILNYDYWKPIENVKNDVVLGTEQKVTNELWYFERQSDTSYKITSCADNTVLDVYNSGTADKTNVQTCKSNDSNAQRWYIKYNGAAYSLVPKCAQDKVLDLAGGDSSDGTNIYIYTPNGTAAQRFNIYKYGDPMDFYGRNVESGKCYNIVTSKNNLCLTSDGSNVIVSENKNKQSQKWIFTKMSDGSYGIKNIYTGKFLDVYCGETKNGTNIQVYTDNATASQRWYIVQGSYGYTLLSKLNVNKAVDVADGNFSSGVNIQLYDKNNTAAQCFSIVETTQTETGDVTGDGQINIEDVTTLQKSLARLTTLNSDQTEVSDVNGDGRVNISDATYIQMFLVGAISEF